MFAGTVKGALRIPVDLTLLSFLVSAASSLAILVKRRLRIRRGLIRVIGFILFLYAIALPSAATDGYPGQKSLGFFLLTMPGMLVAAILLGELRQKRAFLRAVTVLATLAAVLALADSRAIGTEYGRAVAFESNPIATARLIGAGMTVAMAQAVAGRRSHGWKLAVLLFSGLIVIPAMLSTGSRGPLLALLLTVFYLVSVDEASMTRVRRILPPRLLRAVGAVLLVVLLVGLGAGRASDAGLARSASVAEDSREQLYEKAIELGLNEGFGVGIGRFQATRGPIDSDIPSYPHNIFLEFFAELGFVGLLAITWLVRRAIGGLAGEPELAIRALFVFTGLCALTSGDINGNRPAMFLAAALVAASWRSRRVSAPTGPAAAVEVAEASRPTVAVLPTRR